jgi:rfaE bifunctional protein kinase chain/domain
MPDLAAVVTGFGNHRALVLGDMVADEYVIGRPARISREAPVLILLHSSTSLRPGGATNSAYNLHRLGARTAVVGIIGDDETGHQLRRTLDDEGIDTSCLLVDPHRPTSTKTRILARGAQEVQQQIVRIDRLDPSPIDGRLRDALIDALHSLLPRVDALVISDYELGAISPELIDASLPLARRHGIVSVADAHGDLQRFRGITAATPNEPEAAATLHLDITTGDDLDHAGAALLADMEAEGILITRASEGIALYQPDHLPYKLGVALPDNTQIVDPTGAGDTVAAVFTLALVGGATMRQAAYLGNIAGGEVVRRLGAAALTPEELLAAVQRCPLPPP